MSDSIMSSGVGDSAWVAVEIVHDVHDGLPLEGVAPFEGRPHASLAEFDSAIGHTGYFYPRPIDPSVFQSAVERWAMWLRWRDTPTTLPPQGEQPDLATVLRADRPRAQVIRQLIGNDLDVDRRSGTRVRAQFRRLQGYQEYLVRWDADQDDAILLDG